MATRPPLKKVPIHLQSAQQRLLIKGGKVVNDDCGVYADVYVEDGSIKMVGNNLVIPGGARVIEAKGKLIMPGGIDISTHLQQPPSQVASVDDFYSGTKAALAGGTTTVFDYVIPEEGQSLLEAFDKCQTVASEKSCCDFGLHVCITWWSDKVSQEMQSLVNDKGVNSFHLDMSKAGWSDKHLVEVLQRCKQLGVLLMVHAENAVVLQEKMRYALEELKIRGPEAHLIGHPEEAEVGSTHHAIWMSDLNNSAIFINNFTSISTARVISEARRSGKVVFSGVALSSLCKNGDEYLHASWSHAASHLTTPPIRRQNKEELIKMLANDDIQLVTSEHKTHNISQKALGKDDPSLIPDGVNGVQERMLLLWKLAVTPGHMDAYRFVSVVSSNPAKLFNLYPKKGKIAVGSDADIVIWDANLLTKLGKESQQHKGDFNIYEGEEVQGGPCMVISNGAVILDQDAFRVTQGSGNYLSLGANCEHVYARLLQRQQTSKVTKVDRQAYNGPAFQIDNVQDDRLQHNTAEKQTDEFYNRSTRSGTKHQQDSSFSLSGAQVDDSKAAKPSMKVSQPPGGKSSILW